MNEPVSREGKRSLSRRAFLGAAGGAAVTSAAVGIGLGLTGDDGGIERVAESTSSVPPPTSPETVPTTTVPATAAPATTAAPAPPPRKLVVVQLGGGNDGLNTVVPDVGFYRDMRTSLALPEADLLELGASATAGLHPALAPLMPYWESGQLLAVQGIGLPDQSFSHFQAMARWWSAGAVGADQRGWLGKWLDTSADVTDYPSTGVGLGDGSPALRGDRLRSLLVRDPRHFDLRSPAGVNDSALVAAFSSMTVPVAARPGIAASQAAIGPTVEAVDLVQSVAVDRGPGGYGPGQAITAALETAAGLFEQRQGTRVVVIGVTGFDTHANQAAMHHTLLDDLATGSAAFFDRLSGAGLAESTLLMTTSEFGRRIRENGSAGTDHGTAGTQLLLGPAVDGGRVVGDVTTDAADPDNLAISLDTRSLYATALEWLAGSNDHTIGNQTEEILGTRPESLALLHL